MPKVHKNTKKHINPRYFLNESLEREDIIEDIREFSKDVAGSRNTYGDVDKLVTMDMEELQEYFRALTAEVGSADDRMHEGWADFLKRDSNEEDDGVTVDIEGVPAKSNGPGSTTSMLNIALDLVGFIPGVGEIADVINAVDYARKKDYLMAALSLVSAIPAIGDVVGKGGKILVTLARGSKIVAKIVQVLRGNAEHVQTVFDKAEELDNENLNKALPEMKKAINMFMHENDSSQLSESNQNIFVV